MIDVGFINIQKIKYFLKDSLVSLWYNRNLAISSIVIVVSSLCLFGFYTLLSSNIDYIGDQFQSQFALIAYLEKGIPEDRVEALKQEIEEIGGIDSINYISEAQAVEECKKLFDEDYTFLEGLEEDNPLRASLEVSLKNLKTAQSTADQISKLGDIVWVKNNQELVTKIISASQFLRRGSFFLMILFSFVSLFIVSNTIKLLVTMRKDDILTMRYMGAENRLIALPFMIEGAIIGIAGAVAAFIITLPGYAYCIYGIRTHITLFIDLYSTWQVAIGTFFRLIALGVLLGVTGSIYAISRYLKA